MHFIIILHKKYDICAKSEEDNTHLDEKTEKRTQSPSEIEQKANDTKQHHTNNLTIYK